jgi:hypothetical protein
MISSFNINRLFPVITGLLLSVTTATAQKISKITFNRSGAFEKMALELDERVIFNLGKDGTIINWGVDYYPTDRENYAGTLHEYAGRVDYYSANDNEAFRGKIKQVGRFLFTYYASYDNEALKGRLKSIGTMQFDYYSSYEDQAYRGYLKTVGALPLSWYGSFENDAVKGKLKSLGTTAFTYYGSFEDKAFQGKIKSIDRTGFTYYSSLDRAEYRGALKTGSPLLFVNGIKYYLLN